MTLEEQVVSLDLAKKLKELGVKQESIFVWSDSPRGYAIYLRQALGISGEINAAFTVGELGEQLPDVFYTTKVADGWKAFHDGLDIGEWALTEADARAKMLVYLIENGHLKVDQTNQPES